MDKLRKILSFMIIVILVITIGIVSKRFFIKGPSEVLVKTYSGYRRYFVHYDHVVRKNDGAVTSDAQALAMLRAVWMNDKDAFVRYKNWVQANLSRISLRKGVRDNLNAYRWRKGAIDDLDPNISADLDYALALILAHRRWEKNVKPELAHFKLHADRLLEDMLKLCAFQALDGKWFLCAEVIDRSKKQEKFLLNTSVYSPAHFKIFYEHTGDVRWLDLVKTSYWLLSKISKGTKTYGGIGLFPDWCAVAHDGKLHVWEARSFDFGWESVRIPYRLALDYYWFSSAEVLDILGDFASFARSEWTEKGKIFCEYTIDGQAKSEYEDAMFYGAYYYAFRIVGVPEEEELFELIRSRLKRVDEQWIWEDHFAHITNGYVWMVEDRSFDLIRHEF